ncbi:MAG TPA: SPOCS domain-containing protein [Caproiciproducens sp.]|nr:SPOCS domain-containing protein [Caproiciproducens sp.]
MDYILNREALAASEVIYDGCQEQPVDLDISLPDYCPDIQRILKCQVYPRIQSRGITGDRLEMDGNYIVKIFYLDSDGAVVHCYDASNSFSAAITMKQSADNARILAFTRVEYINCRATSPRRLDIHGAFSLCAKVISQEDVEVVSNIDGNGIEQLKNTLTINKTAGFSQQQFSVDEVLELGAGKPAADNLIRTDAFAILQDTKVVVNKLMISGEVYVKFLYSSSEKESPLEVMEYAIPFNQMLDCDGASEDCLSDVQLSVSGIEAQIKNDYSGDKVFFDVQVKVYATAAVYKSKEVTLVTDAYSKLFELNLSYKQRNLENLIDLASDSYVSKSNLNLEDNTISKVLDIWNEMSSVTANIENGQINYKGKVNLCILALNAENKPFYFERLTDFEYSRPYSKDSEQTRCSANVMVAGISYRITGSGIDVKTELKLSANIYRQVSLKIITDATADETKPRAQDKAAALSIYYADAGESLWDIARTYCTSVNAIKLENDLTGEFVENRGMLLIPM